MIQAALTTPVLTAPIAAASRDAPLTARSRALDRDMVAIDLRLLGVDAFERRQVCERNAGRWSCGKTAQDFSVRLLDCDEATIALTPTRPDFG